MKSGEKRTMLTEQSLNRSNITVKSRQSNSKSPMNNRSNRATKTESFEVVMARLKAKKTPGNTPTKGNSARKGFVY